MRRDKNDLPMYRLGLDLGSASIGWAVLRLDSKFEPDYLLRLGVRIFPSGRKAKDGTSLAANRRLKRQQRRRRDRMLRRKTRLLKALVDLGLLPQTAEDRAKLKDLNPYELRARGLRETLTLNEFGRALFHLNQRRGFRSNRKSDRKGEETGALKTAIRALNEQIMESHAETLGEFLYARQQSGAGVRARRHGQGSKTYYDFYVDRSLVSSELDLLWSRQAAYHPSILTQEALERIRDIIFHQRPLRPVDPGRCSLDPAEPRAPLALPSVQRFRILQEVNNLRVRQNSAEAERALDERERSVILGRLLKGQDFEFATACAKLKLPAEAKFNLESERRKKLKGDATAFRMAKPNAFGKRWHELDASEQEAVVAFLLDDSVPDEVVAKRLVEAHHLTQVAAENVLTLPLPEGYGRLSSKVIARLLPALHAGLTYDKAILEAGFETTDSSGDGSLDELPYYGKVLERHVAFGSGDPSHSDEVRFGRIANPSVHIALNELRKLVNRLIRKYGKPTQVSLELTRDLKLGWRRAREIEREQAARQQENEELADEIRRLGVAVSGESILRLRLFRELGKATAGATRCVYTGEQISLSQLFGPEVQVDHILPYSRTLDDSIANKILSKARANRVKGNQTPHEAFAHSPSGFDWGEILLRAQSLPRGRDRRFCEDAMNRFEVDNGFIARQLTDTAYMSRLAREYLTSICPANQIWVTTGALTGLLRAKWGLNRLLSHDDVKNRLDHRHHAIDAVVIGSIDRSLVKRVSDAAGRAAQRQTTRLVDDLDAPWPSFHSALANALQRVVISHRPDHNPRDALHNETAYGLREALPNDQGGAEQRVVHSYVTLESLVGTKPDAIREHVVDPELGTLIADALSTTAPSRTAQAAAIEALARSRGVRRVRWAEKLRVIPIRSRQSGRPYKFVKGDGNYCYEIYIDQKSRWRGDLISNFTANQPTYDREFRMSSRFRTETFEGHPLLMRLVVNDMVRLGDQPNGPIYRVQKLSEGKITLAYHTASGDPGRDQRHIPGVDAVMTVAPGSLQSLNARRVFVDILGRVMDPAVRDVRANRGDCQ